jgi:PAS domain S-box-containing protein
LFFKFQELGLDKVSVQGLEIIDLEFHRSSSSSSLTSDVSYRSAATSPILGPAGECLGITVCFSNPTAEKQLDKLKLELEQKVKERTKELEEINTELLRENKERRRVQSELTLVSMVAQKTDTGVIITDKNRQTVWVNKAFTKATGYTLKDMYGKSPGRVLQCNHTDRGTVQKMAYELKATKGLCVDVLNRRKDGTFLMVNLDITPVFDEEGNLHHFVALQREINPSSVEQMRAAAVEQAKAQALANKMKTDFIMNMSHELRTPLNGILGMTSALLHSSLQDGEDIRQGLETILVSSKLLLTLINNIIDLSKIESGKMALDESSSDLLQLVKETVAACQPLARDKKIVIQYEFDERVCKHAICDSLKVRQVLINLIGNALKFTRAGGDVKVMVTKGDRRVNAYEMLPDLVEASPESRVFLKFAVSDQGPGIPEDKIATLFGRFVQLDQSQETQARYGGSGLGLHISKEFVNLMRGTIWVEHSEIGKGSTFAFVIPVIPCVDQQASLVRAQLATTMLTERLDNVSQSWPPLRILVVEDNAINQKVILRLLSRFGFTHQVANNGQEAIEILEKDLAFDLILMDVQMPVMDGLTAARKINEMFGKQRPKIAALTANVMKTEMAACIQAGMDFYISKPVTTKKLFNFFQSMFKQNGTISGAAGESSDTETGILVESIKQDDD